METNCNTCFYKRMQNSFSSPCQNCREYDHYVKDSVYFWGKELEKNEEPKHDAVNKPKHYMLFPEQGIEVRHVIKKLVEKMEDCPKYGFSGTDFADYFQAMQYFMRFMDKNGKEDLEKGIWYINKIIEAWDDNAADDT